MDKPSLSIKRRALAIMTALIVILSLFTVRVFYIQFAEGETLQEKAFNQQTRDRLITPDRGSIYDRNMVGLAVTETVYSVSVIHAQVKDAPRVSQILSERLEMPYDEVREKVTKRVALMRIKTKVDKTVADEIRNMGIPGIVVDEDVKRVYPYSTLASSVIGFVGRDNQGIIGLEAKYDKYLKGESGKILTETDVAGRELESGRQYRVAPTEGYDLVLSLDSVLQSYAEQTIEKIVAEKGAKRGVIILMDPKNGEIFNICISRLFAST